MIARNTRHLFWTALLIPAILFSGCSTAAKPDPSEEAADSIAAEAAQDLENMKGEPVPYTLDVEVKGLDDKNAAKELRDAMKGGSQLESMRDDPPDSRVGLERRAVSDRDEAKKLLQSRGYYDGTSEYGIDWKASPVKVLLTLIPGTLYHVGKSAIEYTDSDTLSQNGKLAMKEAPNDLRPFGLKDGMPAQASDITAAVSPVPEWFWRRGFPSATIQRVRYRLYPSKKILNPLIEVKTGPYAQFGPLKVQGTEKVKQAYLEKLQPWNHGDVWNKNRVLAYQNTLIQTGLFREARVEPGLDEKDGKSSDIVPVHLFVKEGPDKRTGTGLSYASDVGFGAKGFWEHRNLFGEGERLRLTGILSQERQEIASSFTKPAFYAKRQNFISNAFLRKEETDAYDLRMWYADAGIARKLSERWWGSLRFSSQGGRVREDRDQWESFLILGVPVTLRREGTDNLLNPTRGTRLQLNATPYWGHYRGSFSAIRSQADFSAYYALLHDEEGNPTDKIVLAAKASVGGMFGSTGSKVERIPAALRFYTGGGGSVRGYKYQSIGALNWKGDPQGGLSFNSLNFEARYKVTEAFGIVPFIDAGMVYDSPMPSIGEDLCWSAGLGFRYYTSIGPVRFDVAVPLDNRNGDQKSFQIYISIGQAF